MDKIYKVYLFTFPNSKYYCGYTSQSLHHRWGVNGNGYQKCPLVYRAIQKYGWDNIKKEVIFTTKKQEEALNKEKEIIEQLNLTNPKNGYNLLPGGDQPPHNDAFLSEQGRKSLSEKSRARWQDPNYRATMLEKMKNNRPTDECIKKGVEAAANKHRGQPALNRQQIEQLNKETLQPIQIYPSITDASIAVTGNLNGTANIAKAAKQQRKTAYGYKWRFTNA